MKQFTKNVKKYLMSFRFVIIVVAFFQVIANVAKAGPGNT